MHVPAYTLPRYVPRLSEVLYDIDLAIPRDWITVDARDRPRIHLGTDHAHANSAGWQYLSRHVAMLVTGEPLHRDEEVHHINGNRLDCRRENLKVMLKESHGRMHARYQLLYMLRDHATGRWLPSDVPPYADQRDELGIEPGDDYGDDYRETNMREWLASEMRELEEVPF